LYFNNFISLTVSTILRIVDKKVLFSKKIFEIVLNIAFTCWFNVSRNIIFRVRLF